MVGEALDVAAKRTYKFLERLTREYYTSTTPLLPGDFILREFALQKWGSKTYIRHLSVTSREHFRRMLIEYAPRHVYYSSARYDNPAAENMDLKGWRSADLTFDIDADHLPECKQFVVELESPLEGKVSLIDETKCIPRAAFRALVLYDALVYELGFKNDQIRMEFSGNRGFHVTVYLDDDDEIARASQDVRREIVNYLKGLGLKEETVKPWLRIRVRGKPLPLAPTTSLAGFRGRVARTAYRIALLRGLKDVASKISSPTPKHLNSELQPVLDEALELAKIEVDEQVTVDTKRLIRVPLSIHGKTGLIVKPVTPNDLESFNISEELSAFKEADNIKVKILASIPPQVTIVGSRFKLHAGDKPRLPGPVATYLMARGLAVLLRS